MTKGIYKTSRICYIIEETAAYLITFLIGGAYLAKLTLSLGFSDSLTALLGSFVNLGCLFQLLAIRIFSHGRVKKKVTILYIVNQLLFALIYLVPFIGANQTIKTILFVFFLLGGYFIFNTVSSPRTNWFMALIPDERRGRFTAAKEAISLVCGVAFRFSMGLVIDHFDSIGNETAAFITCGLTIVVLMVIHTLSLVFAKEKEPAPAESSSVIAGIKEVVRDKKISPIITLGVIWAICYNICTPFLGTYQVKELGFSMTYVAVLAAIYAVARIGASVFLGRYADKNTFARMLRICYVLVSVSYLAIVFTTPANGHSLYMVYEIFMAAAMGGINSAEINLIFDYASPEKRKNALSVKQTFCGLCGFGATLAVTPLVNYIQQSGNKVLGLNLYAQQMLSVISFVLCIVLIVFVDRTIIKKKS